ncbi:MAG: type II secretion system protein [Bdellovibrionales bacterium]
MLIVRRKKPLGIRAQAGLSLIELAIVLGVMGLVSGAIWVAASSVREQQPIQDSVQIVTEIASNVRGIYTGFPTASAPSLSEQISRGIFPQAVVNDAGSDTINPWGGTISLDFPSGRLSGFSINYTLPTSLASTVRNFACMEMVTRIPGTATTNPSTGSAWSTSGTLPSGDPPALDPTQGMGPALIFVNTGGWKNVTGVGVSTLFSSGDCRGFAFYYRL